MITGVWNKLVACYMQSCHTLDLWFYCALHWSLTSIQLLVLCFPQNMELEHVTESSMFIYYHETVCWNLLILFVSVMWEHVSSSYLVLYALVLITLCLRYPGADVILHGNYTNNWFGKGCDVYVRNCAVFLTLLSFYTKGNHDLIWELHEKHNCHYALCGDRLYDLNDATLMFCCYQH